jgi:CheY-like chemotaxis protein
MYNMPNARVAVIDDDRMVREMLELGLSREGYEVRTAMDGMAALELVKVFDPELIVLDIMMPKIDGVTLLAQWLREITQAPIVMLTAKGGTEDKVRSLSSGADDYLVKPFVFEELIARLQAKLRRPQLIEENVLRWHDVSINPGRAKPGAVQRGSRVYAARVRSARSLSARAAARLQQRSSARDRLGPRLRGWPEHRRNLHLVSSRKDRSPGRAGFFHPDRPRRGLWPIALSVFA